jgi:2-hydroxymuconate-semialdehyde hydrolase
MNMQPAVLEQIEHTASHAVQSTADGRRGRLLKGIAVEARRFRVGEIDTSVLAAGQGSPLLLLHGGIECGGVYWAPVMSALAERYRVIVPDAPGLGESTPAQPALDQNAFNAWFAELLRLTCNEPPALVAHSLLGSFAARFAADSRKALRRMLIYGTPGIGRYRMPLGLMVTAIRFELHPSERNNERFERWALLDRDRTASRDPDWFKAFSSYSLSRAIVPHVKQTMRRLIKAGTTQIPDETLRSIETPTALLSGRHDRMVPLRLAETASEKFGWPLHVIDDAGHAPHIEQPEQFVAALHNALARSI